MRAFTLGVLGLAAMTATAASAADTSECWSYGGATGVFGWDGTPSVACRDVARTTPAPPPAPPRATQPGGASPRPIPGSSDTQVTFSGSAYFGVAVTF